MAKIYVASSWRNPIQPSVIDLLRLNKQEVYDFRNPAEGVKGFSWSDIDGDWLNWTAKQYMKYLDHPLAEKHFKLDFDAMKWADTCILLLPSGRSAHAEAGWMKGAGKRVFVYTINGQEPELMYKMFDGVFDDMAKLIMELKTADQHG